MLLHIFCFALAVWPGAVHNIGAAAQTTAQRNILPAAAGGRAGATTTAVNGRTFSNTRILGQVSLQHVLASQIKPTVNITIVLCTFIFARIQYHPSGTHAMVCVPCIGRQQFAAAATPACCISSRVDHLPRSLATAWQQALHSVTQLLYALTAIDLIKGLSQAKLCQDCSRTCLYVCEGSHAPAAL